MFGLGLPELILLLILAIPVAIVFCPTRIINPITSTFWYALVWGGFTLVIPWLMSAQYSSLPTMIGTSVFGAAIIAFGFLLRRRSRASAYGLIALALLDMVTRFLMHQAGYLMPLVLLVLAFRAAIYLNKHEKA